MRIKKKLTIVIPVNEKKETIAKFIEGNRKLLESSRVIVINKAGGEELRQFAERFISSQESLWEARKRGILLVETPFVLILDADVILPFSYVEKAIKILEEEKDVIAISIEFEKVLGHLPFGHSIWKTEWLKKLYDWDPSKRTCECLWMWSKVHKSKKRIETMCLRAKHLNELKFKF